jgi:putative addiction module component (TIGR02574 family)
LQSRRLPEDVMSREKLLEEARKLSVDDRTLLAHEIWRSVRDEAEAAGVSEEDWREIERRIDEYDRDPSTVIPWEQARARIEAALARKG